MPHLPPVSVTSAQRIAQRLRDKEGMQRPPLATAKMLIFIGKQEDTGIPFPNRPTLARHLGISLPAVDVVLSHRQATGDIIERIERVAGNVKGRPSTIKLRYFRLSNAMRRLLSGGSGSRAPHGRGGG